MNKTYEFLGAIKALNKSKMLCMTFIIKYNCRNLATREHKFYK